MTRFERTVLQARDAASYIRAMNKCGLVVVAALGSGCGSVQGEYEAGAGVAVEGTVISLGTCPAGQIWTSTGTSWMCMAPVAGGGVTNVTATAPLVSSGGATPAISLQAMGLVDRLIIENEPGFEDTRIRIKARYVQIGAQTFTNVDQVVDITVTGAGGRESAAEQANKWYAIDLISDGSATPRGFLTSAETSPPLPAGFTEFRRVGWVRNNNNQDLRRFRQIGNVVWYQPWKSAGEPNPERRLYNQCNNTALVTADGVTACGTGTQAAHPNTLFPPGVRQVFIKNLMNGAAAAPNTDAYWNNSTGTTVRRLARCTGQTLCETDTWITLTSTQTFQFQVSSASWELYAEAEAYVDENI
jgi:hypothetical protein